MQNYCYVPREGGTMLRVHFGFNEAEPTKFEGGWPEALDQNLELGLGADEVLAMYICYLFHHWQMYEYLVNLRMIEILTIFNFVITMIKTGLYDSVRKANREKYFVDGRSEILH